MRSLVNAKSPGLRDRHAILKHTKLHFNELKRACKPLVKQAATFTQTPVTQLAKVAKINNFLFKKKETQPGQFHQMITIPTSSS